MLSCLRIKNFALIDQLELDFSAGLNVMTGETGAGKSIILDAIDLVLGGKGSSRLIRQGTQKATLEATFSTDEVINAWLKDEEIEFLEEDLLICSRELLLYKDSLRSRFRINGVIVSQKLITKLRDRLVEITAQGQTILLMLPERQRDLLDLYGGKSLLKQRQQVALFYQVAQTTAQALEKRRQSEQQRLQRLDFLSYQLQELEAAKLTDAMELENLQQERERLHHVVELQQLSYKVYQILYQNDHEQSAAADLLGEAESLLTNMAEYDKEIDSIMEMVTSAANQIVEAGHQINAYGNSLEADPERLLEVEERISLLKQICRKYGQSLAEALAYYEKVQQELEELNENNQSIEKLEEEYKIQKENLNKECEKLTQLRTKAAQKLDEQIIAQLKPLAMEKVRFECRLYKCPAYAHGADEVVYYFSPNPGEDLQPLANTASGGEMSRFLLALKACFSDSEQGANTLIFDEIDAGVSGKVAQAIAEKLHQLSKRHQVLCVTHQALIAAMADNHFKIEKQTIDDHTDVNEAEIRTVIRVQVLDNHLTRKEELAQLTGGHSANEAMAFAESLLTKAAAHRHSKNK